MEIGDGQKKTEKINFLVNYGWECKEYTKCTKKYKNNLYTCAKNEKPLKC